MASPIIRFAREANMDIEQKSDPAEALRELSGARNCAGVLVIYNTYRVGDGDQERYEVVLQGQSQRAVVDFRTRDLRNLRRLIDGAVDAYAQTLRIRARDLAGAVVG
jgi:hypothetical protein